jgi:Protein involved in meta-pathway of phenol degradation
MPAQAQNRGVYPLGMSATSSGVTPSAGFTYVNQLLFYSRDHAKDDAGNTLPVTGQNYVLMDMNTLAWVSKKKFIGGAVFSAVATLPFAKNNLTSDIKGQISGGGGFADSYYMPFILGWNRDRVAVRAIYGFLAPTGRFAAGANDNVGSGYWTHALSSGQTFYLTNKKRLILSAFQMYEFHTTQEGTGIHAGETFDLDYSLMQSLPVPKDFQLQIGVAGYEQRQTTAKTGPTITPDLSKERYAVNALGFAANLAFPSRKLSLGLKFFKEFADRSTFQGFSVQFSGSLSF